MIFSIGYLNGETKRLEFDTDEVSVGCGKRCDIVLSTSNAEKFHGRFALSDGMVFYHDRSAIGTFINGDIIQKSRREVFPNDKLDFFGDTVTFLGDKEEKETVAKSPSTTQADHLTKPKPGRLFEQFTAEPKPHPMIETPRNAGAFAETAEAMPEFAIGERPSHRREASEIEETSGEMGKPYGGDEKTDQSPTTPSIIIRRIFGWVIVIYILSFISNPVFVCLYGILIGIIYGLMLKAKQSKNNHLFDRIKKFELTVVDRKNVYHTLF